MRFGKRLKPARTMPNQLRRTIIRGYQLGPEHIGAILEHSKRPENEDNHVTTYGVIWAFNRWEADNSLTVKFADRQATYEVDHQIVLWIERQES